MRTPNRILANRLLRRPARSGSRSSLLAVNLYARSFYLQRLINSEICALIERSLLFLSVALRLGVLTVARRCDAVGPAGHRDGGLARLDLAQQRQALGERPQRLPKNR